jgi:4-(2-carboxyphenyl)-2-oxobut-3-enoate aldolase
MLTAKDVGGLMAMMPAFATDEANTITARNTVDVGRLHAGLDRMVRDGANVISTTGSFGECHTLLPDEFEVLANEAAAVVNQRTALFVGITSDNAREAYERMKIVSQTKANGVLVGIPYYFPSTAGNAVRFLRDLSEAFPKLNIMLYHNPTLHNITLRLEMFDELIKIPQIVGMKDSHRDTLTMLQLLDKVKGKISVMVNQFQSIPFVEMGAAGFWSIDAWMGPWPLLALRDALKAGDFARAKSIILDLAPAGTRKTDLSWRETASKIAIRYAGYVNPGPLRAPFLEIPPEVDAAAKKKAERWNQISLRYGKPNSEQAA